MSLPRPGLRLPFIHELRKYSWATLRHDLIAGATLTLVSIPQAIGFALILGLPPMPVILSIVVGGFVSALFFSSHHHVFGPTTSVCLITAATMAANATWACTRLQLAAYLAFLIGVIQFVAGLFSFRRGHQVHFPLGGRGLYDGHRRAADRQPVGQRHGLQDPAPA